MARIRTAAPATSLKVRWRSNESSRVVLNRVKVGEVKAAVGQATGAVAEAIVKTADPPDETPYGVGLVQNGGWLAYVGPLKVAGGGLDGKQPKKPRALRVLGSDEIQALAGFGFPGRFQELGTIHQPARPFLSPAVFQVIPQAHRYMAPVIASKLGRRP